MPLHGPSLDKPACMHRHTKEDTIDLSRVCHRCVLVTYLLTHACRGGGGGSDRGAPRHIMIHSRGTLPTPAVCTLPTTQSLPRRCTLLTLTIARATCSRNEDRQARHGRASPKMVL